MLDAVLAAGLQDGRYGPRRGRDDGQIRRFGHVGDVGVALVIEQDVVLWIDRVHLALEIGFQHVAEDHPGNGILTGAGAEDRDGTGIE